MVQKIIFLIIFLISSTLYADGITELRNAIDYEMQRTYYIPPITDNKNEDRGKILKTLSKFNKVGFSPIISILPKGAYLSVGPIIVSSDRRYVRIGLTPFFSNIGSVDTFNFGR